MHGSNLSGYTPGCLSNEMEQATSTLQRYAALMAVGMMEWLAAGLASADTLNVPKIPIDAMPARNYQRHNGKTLAVTYYNTERAGLCSAVGEGKSHVVHRYAGRLRRPLSRRPLRLVDQRQRRRSVRSDQQSQCCANDRGLHIVA